MASRLKPGDPVSWQTSQGETHGTVEKELTRATRVRSHLAKASPEHPEYLVRSDKTGARAAHRPEALKKR